MRARSGEAGCSFRHRPVKDHAQFLGIDPHGREIQRGCAACRDAAAHANGAAGKICQRIVGHGRNAGVQIGAETPSRRQEIEIDHGGAASPADIVERETIGAHRTAKLVPPGREIAPQRKIGGKALERDAQVVADQAVAGQLDAAPEVAVYQARVDKGVPGRNPVHTDRQRERPRRAVEPCRALLCKTGKPGVARDQRADAQVVGDIEVGESAIERRRGSRVFKPQALSEKFGIAQAEGKVVVAHPVLGEVDKSVAIEEYAPARQDSAPLECAVVDLHARAQRDVIAKRIGGEPFEKIGRVDLAEQAESAFAVRQLERCHALALAPRVEVAVPGRPGAVAAYPHLVRIRKAEQGCDSAVRRRRDIGFDIEIVPVRFRMQKHGQPVVLPQARIAIDVETAVLHLHLRRQIDALRLVSGDTGSEGKIVYLQFVDRDVETGEDRPFLFAGKKLGHT